jgi:hypothetical protein
MASSEIGKKLMRDEMNHIDELFKQGLEGANVTPPAGVFEQCINQLNAQPVDLVSGLKATSKATKGWLGLSSKVAIGIGTGVLAVTAIVVAIIDTQEERSARLNRVEVKSSDSKMGSETAGAANDPNVGGINEQSVAQLQENVGVFGEVAKDVVDQKANQEVSDMKGQSPANTENRQNMPPSLVGGILGDVNLGGGGARENGFPTVASIGKRNGGKDMGPCGNHRPQWRPVISENIAGMVSLDLEGDYGVIGVNWGDGLGGEVIENRGATERITHSYWVEKNRNFRVKLVHSMPVSKADGGLIWCKDSQWLTLQVTPSNEASVVSVPDVFTPNGDGLNETFYVEMAKPLSYDITILDAKQRTVFRSNDYKEVWTGICGNMDCEEANYRVILAYKYSGDREWKYIRKSIKLLRKSNNNIQN